MPSKDILRIKYFLSFFKFFFLFIYKNGFEKLFIVLENFEQASILTASNLTDISHNKKLLIRNWMNESGKGLEAFIIESSYFH